MFSYPQKKKKGKRKLFSKISSSFWLEVGIYFLFLKDDNLLSNEIHNILM